MSCAGEPVAAVQVYALQRTSKHLQNLLHTDHSAPAEQAVSGAQQTGAKRSLLVVGRCMYDEAADLLAQALEPAGAHAPGAVGEYSGQEMLTALARGFCEGGTLEGGGS